MIVLLVLGRREPIGWLSAFAPEGAARFVLLFVDLVKGCRGLMVVSGRLCRSVRLVFAICTALLILVVGLITIDAMCSMFTAASTVSGCGVFPVRHPLLSSLMALLHRLSCVSRKRHALNRLIASCSLYFPLFTAPMRAVGF